MPAQEDDAPGPLRDDAQRVRDYLGMEALPWPPYLLLETLDDAWAALRPTKENALLRGTGLSSRMPEGWRLGDSPLARYDAAGVELSPVYLRVAGAIMR